MGNACEKCEHPTTTKEQLKTGDEPPSEKVASLPPDS